MVTAMLFAGGIGARMKSSDLPKQFLEVGGKPIIVHTMEHFSRHPACKEDWIEYLVELIERFSVKKIRSIVPGGETGFASIHNGVVATAAFSTEPEDIILICDGVRPMLSDRLITDCILETKKYKTAVPVTPSIDSLLYSPDGENCKKSYDRNTMYVTQANPISSSELFIELGESVHLFKGERFNIKVTTPEDLVTLRAQFYYENYKKFAKEELKYGL